jgi:hypothetical protein
MKQNKLVVDKSLTVTLVQLIQGFTYDGVLEGFPNEAMNQKIMAQAEAQAAKLLHQRVILALPPVVKTNPSDPVSDFEGYQKLPEVCCMALLKCHDAFKDKTKDYATLGVVWYQDEFAFPIAANILADLKNLPFKQYCSEFEY